MPGFRLLLLAGVSVCTPWSFGEKEAWVQDAQWSPMLLSLVEVSVCTPSSFREKEAWVQDVRWSLVGREPWVEIGCFHSLMSSAMAVPVSDRHCVR
jgi:hypothetical protein